ncbi:MAG: GNAT family N-acetyltransferase, partial [Firmicutes bacterium]|nr:GNAT family N-acetyltransferase [Bacillota bacterium]
IMQDQAAVLELIGRLQTTLDAEYLKVYGGFLNGELIAYVSLACCEDLPEIQIEVLPEHQGRGFGYEMLERTIRMAFETLDVEKLKYVVLPSNLPSIALVEKLGGVLQKPKSYAEEMLLKTYVIE